MGARDDSTHRRRLQRHVPAGHLHADPHRQRDLLRPLIVGSSEARTARFNVIAMAITELLNRIAALEMAPWAELRSQLQRSDWTISDHAGVVTLLVPFPCSGPDTQRRWILRRQVGDRATVTHTPATGPATVMQSRRPAACPTRRLCRRPPHTRQSNTATRRAARRPTSRSSALSRPRSTGRTSAR